MVLKPFQILLAVVGVSVASFGSTVTYTEQASVAGGCANAPLQGTCTVVTGPTNPLRSSWDVLQFSTTGEIMVGMTATVTFSDGNKSTATWARTGAVGSGAGAATVNVVGGTHNWSIAETGNTFTGIFTVTNNTTAPGTPLITDVVLDGSVGSNSNCATGTPASIICATIFDRTSNADTSTGPTSNEQTPNSHRGLDWAINGGNATGTFNINVIYSNEFRINSSNACYTAGNAIPENTTAPCGDEWQKLEFLFTGNTGIAKNAPFQFVTDTDTTTSQTPEPASAGLFGAGLLASVIFVLGRYRRITTPTASIFTSR